MCSHIAVVSALKNQDPLLASMVSWRIFNIHGKSYLGKGSMDIFKNVLHTKEKWLFFKELFSVGLKQLVDAINFVSCVN